MIHKVLRPAGGGAYLQNPFWYLFKQDREIPPHVLVGDPDETWGIVQDKCLDFKVPYTSGVLTFEEKLDDATLLAIAESWKEIVTAGIEDKDINVCIISHGDHDRSELHFVIPNVHLDTGKFYKYYFSKTDFPLFDSWQELTNYKYNLSSPKGQGGRDTHLIVDEEGGKKLIIKDEPSKRLPEDKRNLHSKIDEEICSLVERGEIKTFEDVKAHLEQHYDVVEGVNRRGGVEQRQLKVRENSNDKYTRLRGVKYSQGFDIDRIFKQAREDLVKAKSQGKIGRIPLEVVGNKRSNRKSVEEYQGIFKRGFEYRSERMQDLYHTEGKDAVTLNINNILLEEELREIHIRNRSTKEAELVSAKDGQNLVHGYGQDAQGASSSNAFPEQSDLKVRGYGSGVEQSTGGLEERLRSALDAIRNPNWSKIESTLKGLFKSPIGLKREQFITPKTPLQEVLQIQDRHRPVAAFGSDSGVNWSYDESDLRVKLVMDGCSKKTWVAEVAGFKRPGDHEQEVAEVAAHDASKEYKALDVADIYDPDSQTMVVRGRWKEGWIAHIDGREQDGDDERLIRVFSSLMDQAPDTTTMQFTKGQLYEFLDKRSGTRAFCTVGEDGQLLEIPSAVVYSTLLDESDDYSVQFDKLMSLQHDVLKKVEPKQYGLELEFLKLSRDRESQTSTAQLEQGRIYMVREQGKPSYFAFVDKDNRLCEIPKGQLYRTLYQQEYNNVGKYISSRRNPLSGFTRQLGNDILKLFRDIQREAEEASYENEHRHETRWN